LGEHIPCHDYFRIYGQAFRDESNLLMLLEAGKGEPGRFFFATLDDPKCAMKKVVFLLVSPRRATDTERRVKAGIPLLSSLD